MWWSPASDSRAWSRPQSFRPPEEEELIWAQYGHTEDGVFTAETMGTHLETGETVNYSKAPGQYDEPEGMFPGGVHTLIECDHHDQKGTSKIELYRLRLDGTGKDSVRLTHFSEVEGFRASNPVVRDDRRLIAFQESQSNPPPGTGDGLYLLDLEKLPEEPALNSGELESHEDACKRAGWGSRGSAPHPLGQFRMVSPKPSRPSGAPYPLLDLEKLPDEGR